jgi:hypothetical protein
MAPQFLIARPGDINRRPSELTEEQRLLRRLLKLSLAVHQPPNEGKRLKIPSPVEEEAVTRT